MTNFNDNGLFEGLEYMTERDYGLPESKIYDRIAQALDVYTYDEILDMNDLDETDVLAYLFEAGYLGIPNDIFYEETDGEDETELDFG